MKKMENIYLAKWHWYAVLIIGVVMSMMFILMVRTDLDGGMSLYELARCLFYGFIFIAWILLTWLQTTKRLPTYVIFEGEDNSESAGKRMNLHKIRHGSEPRP